VAPKLANLPKNERDYYRMKVDETYRLFDEVIMLMMNRLGTILSIDESEEEEFFRQLRLLNSVEEWVQKERDVRLCKPVSDALREMHSILPKIKAKLSLQDDYEVRKMFGMMGVGRASFADYITDSLKILTELEEHQPHSHQRYLEAREVVKKKYDEFRQKRKELIGAEMELYDAV
jgi:hypothetical protein